MGHFEERLNQVLAGYATFLRGNGDSVLLLVRCPMWGPSEAARQLRGFNSGCHPAATGSAGTPDPCLARSRVEADS